MRTKNRLLALALCLAMALSLLPGGARAAEYMDSGALSMPKLGKEEIAALVKVESVADADQPYAAAPGVTAPYSLGSVRQDVLQAGLTRLNNLRRIAGLPGVALDSGYTALAQAASVVNAANGVMTHSPACPAGMDNSLYQQGKTGAGSSNIACYMGWRPENGPIAFSVDMWMEDSDGFNVDRLGHRRWQLNPAMAKTGFGAATDANGWVYTAEYSFDSGASAPDYNFIAWPASGYFPSSEFGGDYAWSVTVNPDKYETPRSGVSVSLRRESDGRTWSFQGSGYAPADSGAFFNVETSGYGVSNCIIFRPDGVEEYEGVYTVTVSGLRAKNGSAADLSYQVEFFDPEELSQPEAPAAPETPTTPETPATPALDPDLPFTDIPESAWYRDFTKAVYEAGLMGGSGDKFNPTGTLSVAEAVTLAARMHASANGTEVPAGDGAWYQGAVDYVLRSGLLDPAFYSVLEDMTRPATRYEMAALLDRAVPAERWTNAVPDPQIPDVRETDEPYGAIVYRWYRAGVVSGGSDGSFNGESNITRAEVAKILCQLYGLA